MALCLIAAAVGLLAGCAHRLAQHRALAPTTFPLIGLAVISLGEAITPYFYPFAAGLLLGLAYDTIEDEPEAASGGGPRDGQRAIED
jgi:XapX domain-containing protein